MTQQLEKKSTWVTPHGEVTATPQILRQLFNAPSATDFELYHFIQLCKAQGLNPFLRDAYLIKYGDDGPASFVTGKETFTQRAEAHPDYNGIEAGVIVQRGEQVEYLKGSFKLSTDELVGGWARVYRKNQHVPVEKSVSFTEYTTNRNLWKSKPSTMIEKVAIVQALREAFPSSFAGLYDSAEVGQELPEITPATVETAPSPNGADPTPEPEPAPERAQGREADRLAHTPMRTSTRSGRGPTAVGAFKNLGEFFTWARPDA